MVGIVGLGMWGYLCWVIKGTCGLDGRWGLKWELCVVDRGYHGMVVK